MICSLLGSNIIGRLRYDMQNVLPFNSINTVYISNLSTNSANICGAQHQTNRKKYGYSLFAEKLRRLKKVSCYVEAMQTNQLKTLLSASMKTPLAAESDSCAEQQRANVNIDTKFQCSYYKR